MQAPHPRFRASKGQRERRSIDGGAAHTQTVLTTADSVDDQARGVEVPAVAIDVPTGNVYDKYTSQHPVERKLMEAFFTSLAGLLPASPPRRILEVGIGEGEIASRIVERWPGAEVVGVDLYDLQLADQWRGRDFTPVFGEITALPFAEDAFDLVLGIEVLEHVRHPVLALQELLRVTSTDLLVSVPREPVWCAANLARGRYVRSLGNTPGHVNHWTKRGFVRLISRQFEVTAVRSPFPWTVISATKPR